MDGALLRGSSKGKLIRQISIVAWSSVRIAWEATNGWSYSLGDTNQDWKIDIFQNQASKGTFNSLQI